MRRLALGALAAAAFTPPAAQLLARGVPDIVLFGDFALLEIGTLHTARSVQLLGPYSRFLWHHLGPSYFYLLLPVYALFGQRATSLFLGALLLNLASALGIVAVATAMAGQRFALWTVGLLGLWIIGIEPARLVSIWNPDVTILPFALLIFLSAALAAGRIALLPMIVLVASFLVQTHLGCLPGSAFALLTSGGMYVWRYRWTAAPMERPSGERKWLVVSLACLAVLWALPLYEQVAADHGNLWEVARFLTSRVRPHPLAEIAPIVSGYLAAMPLAMVTSVTAESASWRPTLTVVFVVLMFALVPPALIVARRRGDAFLGALGVVSAVMALGAYAIGTRIKGPVADYLLQWASAPGFTLWCALGGALGPAVAQRAPAWLSSTAPRAGAIACLAAVAAATSATSRLAPVQGNAIVAAMADAVSRELGAGRDDTPMLRIASHDSWPATAGIALKLYKRSLPFAVDPEWLFMFGEHFRSPTAPGRELLIGDRAFHEEARSLPDRRLLATHNDTYVYLLEDPGYVQRHLYRGSTRLVAAGGASGDPALVVDGFVPAEGSRWNGQGCLVLSNEGFVTVELPPGPIEGARVSAEGSNVYRVLGSRDGRTFERLRTLRRVGGRGMRVRIVRWGDRTPPRYLRIEPEPGDGRYSIGEIQFLVSRVAS